MCSVFMLKIDEQCHQWSLINLLALKWDKFLKWRGIFKSACKR